MRVLGLTALIRRRRKYSSYQGEVGKKAENLIQRQFEASKTMEKRYTEAFAGRPDPGTGSYYQNDGRQQRTINTKEEF